MRLLTAILLIAICMAGGTAAPAFANAGKVDDLIKKKTKELLKTYRGQKDLSIAIVDTDRTAISSKITTIAYKVVFDDGRFSIVERELLNQLTKELALQQTGLVQIASQIGRMTGANLILLVRKEEADMRLRIVSVEKGVILAYNFIPLSEIAEAESGGKGSGGSRPAYGTAYHSPVIAGLVSVFPVWSGSWNAGWTEWGMALVVCKTGSWIPVIVFWWQSESEKKQLNNFNTRMKNFFSAYPSTFTPSNITLFLLWNGRLQRSADHAREKLKQSLMYCSIAWAAVTVSDIIGSVFYIISRNPQYGSGAWGSESLRLSWSIGNRFYYSDMGESLQASPDGLDLSVSYHF